MSDRRKHRRVKESRLLNLLMTRAGLPLALHSRPPVEADPGFRPNRAMRRRAA
jgi:hypothetical protein